MRRDELIRLISKFEQGLPVENPLKESRRPGWRPPRLRSSPPALRAPGSCAIFPQGIFYGQSKAMYGFITSLVVLVFVFSSVGCSVKRGSVHDDTLFTVEKRAERKKRQERKQQQKKVQERRAAQKRVEKKRQTTRVREVSRPQERAPIERTVVKPRGNVSASGVTLKSSELSRYDTAMRVFQNPLATAEARSNARTLMEQVVLQNPRFVEAMVNLGLHYAKSGDLLRADNYFTKAIRTVPGYAPACLSLAQLQVKSRQITRAKNLLSTCLKPAKLTAADRLRYAQLLWQMNQSTKALGVLERMKTSDEVLQVQSQIVRGKLLTEKRQFDQAGAALQEALKSARERGSRFLEAATLEALGNLYWKQGEEAKAISQWKAAIARYDRLTEPHAHLGRAALKSGDATRALKHFRQILALDRNDAVNALHLGLTYKLQKQYKLAERYYLRALRLNKRQAETYLNLGILYHKQFKLPQKALRYYSQYQKLDPKGGRSRDVQILIKNAKQQAGKKQRAR